MSIIERRYIYRGFAPPTDMNVGNEPPPRVGDLWCDLSTSSLKICTNAGPYTWAGIGGGGGAPSDASYVTTVAEASLSNEKVLGVDVVMRGTLASRPAASVNGRLYFVADASSERLTRDNGTTWDDIEADWDFVTGKPTTFAPSAHATSHQHGGSDEVAVAAAGANAIPKADAGGKLAVGWIPSHATTHQHGGSDEVATVTPAANAIPKADASNKLAAGWLTEVLSLDNLSGVSLVAPVIGDVLRFNGSAWADDILSHSDLGGVTIDQHHARDHAITGSTHTHTGGTAGRFLRETGATTFVFEAIPTSKGGTVLSPAAAINVIIWRAPFACTVTNVRGYRVGGTGATINARRNGASNHLASDLSLTSADTWMDGGAVSNTAYVAGDKLEIMVVSITGSPTQVAIQVDFTRP